ncbi:hypothetical protein PINS_up002276 [Pythium insidiosum]|nr:hypothetical protein PINS_up002276 [Pythium insidiosum]
MAMAGKRSKKAAHAGAKQQQPKDDAEVSTPSSSEPSTKVMIDDGSDDDIQELKVNEKFAKSYLERKRKEELTRLEKYGNSDDDESDSESEDEDGEELTPALDADIKKTLELIRKRDPIIYEQGVSFFKPRDDDSDDSASDSEEEDGKLAASKGKAKDKTKKKQDAPVYYKDLVRQHVMAGDVGSDEDDDDNDDGERVMTYQEEQQQLKKDILKSMQQAEKEVASDDEDEDGDDDSDLEGGLFSIRKKTDAEEQADEKDFEQFKTKYGSKLKKDELDPEAFLENYLSSGGWKEKKNVIPHYEDIVKEDDEDAEELEKMEQFEHSYNFRYEEEGSSVIQTYSRQIEDSMRRKDDSRKRKREERKERKALERLKKEEELKRLKNLKQAEIQSKLEKIAKLMGKTSTEEERLQALSKDLEGEFDPEEYDRRMQQVFDEEYYNEEDPMEKPTWDEEEDKALFAGLPVDDEDEEEAEEETAMEDADEAAEDVEEDEQDEAAQDDDDEMEDAQEHDEPVDDDDDEDNEMKWQNMTPEELQRAKEKYLDELYGLDYEDLIGDIKCRFKYRQVAKNDFGLTADEIMAADDKELKQLVSLKRLAPYREEEYAVNRRKIKQFKKSLQEKHAEEKELAKKNSRNKKKKSKLVANEDEQQKEAEPTEDAQPTKKRKRNKKNKQSTESMEPKETDAEAETQVQAEKDDESQNEPAKKKNRRSKKKTQPKNDYAATGLSSSRLESYKLLKAKK